MYCPNCGTVVPDGSLFCPVCGTSFQPQPQPVAPQPQPAAKKEAAPAVDREKLGLLAIILAGVSVFLLMLAINRYAWTWFTFMSAGALLAFTIIKKFFRYDHMMMAIPMTVYAFRWIILYIWAIVVHARGVFTFTGVMSTMFMIGASVLLWLVSTGVLKNKKLFSLIIFGCCVILLMHFVDNGTTGMAKNGIHYTKTFLTFGYGSILFHLVYVLMFLTDDDWFKQEIDWIKSWFRKKSAPVAQPAPAPQAVPASPADTSAPSGRMFCPVCGKEQEPGSLFCAGCGSKLPNA